MELGIAKEKLDTDSASEAALMDPAHHHAKRAIVERRDLARGIHPGILTDRGLDADLSALTGPSPVPVDVVNTLAERLPSRLASVQWGSTSRPPS